MFDIQKLMDALSDQGMRDRARYHVTLGKLAKAVEGMPSYGVVKIDSGEGIEAEHSYRGYYSDLSFEMRSNPTPKDEMIAMLKRASSDEYIGYKGGEYHYDDNTPLWVSPYGCTGSAITSIKTDNGDIVLILTNVDD